MFNYHMVAENEILKLIIHVEYIQIYEDRLSAYRNPLFPTYIQRLESLVYSVTYVMYVS